MDKYFKYIFLIILIFIGACSNTFDYLDDDIAAIVNGEEITIGDLRFLYPDEYVLDMIDGTVKIVLVMQEAKQMDLDVYEDIDQAIDMLGTLPPTGSDNPFDQSVREFAEKQAQKLGMKPEEYQKEYVAIMAEQNAYMNAYVQEILGVPSDDEAEIEAYNKKANHLLNELVKEHGERVMILIK